MRPFLFLIPLLPLVGFLFNFTVGVRVLGRRAAGATTRVTRPRTARTR